MNLPLDRMTAMPDAGHVQRVNHLPDERTCLSQTHLESVDQPLQSPLNTRLTCSTHGGGPYGILPSRLNRWLGQFRCLNPGCMPLVRGTKSRPGSSQPERLQSASRGIESMAGALSEILARVVPIRASASPQVLILWGVGGLRPSLVFLLSEP